MEKKKSFFKRLFSPTPREWKQVRNLAMSIVAVIGGIGGLSATIPGVEAPEWFATFGWYVAALFTAVAVYSQSKEVK